MKKKNNTLVIVLMLVIIFLLVGFYILFLTDTISFNNNNINNKEDNNSMNNENIEVSNINDFINEYYSVLGWNYIVSKRKEINGQINKNEDILSSISNRQLIIGEYISSNQNNESKFIVFNGIDGSKIDSNNLHSETSIAFYPYEDFNIEYKKMFGEDFDISKQEIVKSDKEYLDYTKYVYYINYRAGSNGIYVKEMSTYDNKCDNNNCSVKVKMLFSDRFKEEFGFNTSNALINYHIKNNLIALDSFKEI